MSQVLIGPAVIDTGDRILDESIYWLSAHFHPEWGDRVPFDVFNRLLAKNIRPRDWKNTDHMDIRVDQISSERQSRSTAELSQFDRPHAGDKPKKTDCPIIVAVYDGVERLLDGNTRINYWVKIGAAGGHTVHVHHIGAKKNE
ncbi:MAG: hypothetical protein O7C03_08485 [Gammaproteobacteria bacterium]|nr:hypothetical protein [Gammaproteobacteria bacterium]